MSEHKTLIFFNYGIVVMWGLGSALEQQVLEQIVKPICLRPLNKQFVENERHQVQYASSEVVAIRNDVIRLPNRFRGCINVRMSISYALAQSTKLSVFEEQGLDLVQSTAHLPQELAEKGHFKLTATELSKKIGKLFVHRSGVDLLSGVLDTPEYFWSKPDTLEELYKKVAEYLEIDVRIEAVKSRLDMLHELFEMLQSRHDATHGSSLEWIVIVLVLIEAVIGVLEFLGTIGIISPVEGQMSLGGRIGSMFGKHAAQWI